MPPPGQGFVSTGCADLEIPALIGFLNLRRNAQKRPMTLSMDWFDHDRSLERRYVASAWQKVQAAAARHYEPGVFTTFAGYEYSPVLPDRGKHHRNIIFRSMSTLDYAVSATEAPSEIDLWQQLERNCTGECEFLTIPHNPIKSWGLAFSPKKQKDSIKQCHRRDGAVHGESSRTPSDQESWRGQYKSRTAAPRAGSGYQGA